MNDEDETRQMPATGGGGSAGGGVRLGGRYELGELLGRGGMAEVRKARDVRLGRVVAVKRLRTDLATDPTFQARFRREAQSAAGLNHPNIVSVYDTGEEMAADGSHVQPYIVMEYVAGRTLRDLLDEGRKVLPERALEITSGILAALDYSHRAGIIHRDIKPANVMVTPAGDIKVMDFGIARAISEGAASVTQTAAVVGTAQYLSPEQARGEVVDSRSDVYSAGCVLYELLAGRPPFVGDSPFSVAYQHVREHAEPPSAHNPEIAPALDAIAMKALAKKIEERYQSAAEMQADLQRHLSGVPVQAPPTAVVPAVAAPVADDATSIFRPDEEYAEQRRSRWPAVLLGLLLLALLAGGIAVGMKLFESAPSQVSVPNVTNMNQRQAERRLEAEGLKLGEVTQANSDEVAEGRVIEQDPAPRSLVDPGSEIDLVVSAGKSTVVIPFVIDETKDEATRILTELGLNVSYETQDSTEPEDQVIATDPNAGEEVEAGTTVTLVLSSGPAEVPNVVGMKERAAREALTDAGFEVEVVYDETTPADPGTVLSQEPDGQSDAARGSTVQITVSDYQEPEPTPTPTPTPTAEPTPTEEPPADGGGRRRSDRRVTRRRTCYEVLGTRA